MAERLYSTQQVADLLGASPWDVDQWIQSGFLEAEQVAGDVRVSERGLVRFLKDRGIDLESVLSAALSHEAEGEPETDGSPEPAAPDASDVRRSAPRPEPGGAETAADVPTRLVEAILQDALKRGADAIYLEPQPDSLTLKLRIDGRLHEKPNFASRLPSGLGPLLMAQFRALARPSEESGQEGTFETCLDGQVRLFRIETRSTPHGDGLVIHPIPL